MLLMKLQNRRKEILNSKSGEFSYVFASVLIVVMLIVASFVWSYTNMLTMIRESKNSAVVGLRYVQSYEGLETAMSGRAGRRTRYTDKTLTDTAVYDQFITAYTKNTKAVADRSASGYYVLDKNDVERYHISRPELEMKVNDAKTIVTFIAEYTISVPYRFMGETLTYINVPVKESVSMQINSITNA